MPIKTQDGKRLVWVGRSSLDHDNASYCVSPTRLTKVEYPWVETGGHSWGSAQSIEVCARFMHACTHIKMKPGAKPVQMSVSFLSLDEVAVA